MRCSAVTNAIFLNLIIFGMGSYIYMVWTQYWVTPQRHDTSTTSMYDRQIYLYNRGYLPNEANKTEALLSRSKHEVRENVTYIKNSRPRIPSSQPHKFHLDTKKFQCLKNDSKTDCSRKTSEFKEKLLTELSNTFADESNILKTGNLNNTYNVHYVGPRENFRDKTPKQVLCELLNTKLQTLKRADIDVNESIKTSMPKREFFENKYFNSCAVIASSGALKNSNLGSFIALICTPGLNHLEKRQFDALTSFFKDKGMNHKFIKIMLPPESTSFKLFVYSHDVVLRFNHAPTRTFAPDVGSKTTVRVLNSQVATKPEFNFLRSSMYKNVTLVVWDPSNYSASLQEWLKTPEHNLFPNFIRYRRQEAKPRIFMMNPLTIWDVWDFLQRNSPSRLRKNPPSSGFLGLRLLLPHCNFVDVVEYVPSTRVTKKCHYFDPDENSACTFGVWHPLSAEKMITYHVNSASDHDVFQTGFVRIKGFRNLKC